MYKEGDDFVTDVSSNYSWDDTMNGIRGSCARR